MKEDAPLVLFAVVALLMASALLQLERDAPPERTEPLRSSITCVYEQVDAVGVDITPVRVPSRECSESAGAPLLAELRP